MNLALLLLQKYICTTPRTTQPVYPPWVLKMRAEFVKERAGEVKTVVELELGFEYSELVSFGEIYIVGRREDQMGPG